MAEDDTQSPQEQASEASPINGVIPPVDKRFKKGKSGNPGGRLKGVSITAAMNKMASMTPEKLRTYKPKNGAEAIAQAEFLRALSPKGHRPAVHYREVIDGKLPETVRHEGLPSGETDPEKVATIIIAAEEALAAARAKREATE